MSDSNRSDCLQSDMNDLRHDAQGPQQDLRVSTRMLSEHALTREQDMDTELMKSKKKKQKKSKCHGNQKLQRFKRKWRARGLIEEEIQALIHTTEQQQHREQQSKRMTEKRKRHRSSQQSMASSIRSMSQLSLSQRSCKRRREMAEDSSSMDDSLSNVTEINLKLERYSKYLRMPRKLLLRSIEIQLNHRLKRVDEQNYILRRLQLIDEHFCVQLIRNQYQSYWNLGNAALIWPVSLRNSERA